MKISGVDIRPGNILEYEGGIWKVAKIQHTQPGKGGAYMQVEMKNLQDGRKTNVRFRSADTVERVRLDTKDYQFLYEDGSMLVFMDQDTYEQVEADEAAVGDMKQWMKEEDLCLVTLWEGNPIVVTPPNFVFLEITETDPGVKGDTSGGGNKPATLETGAVVRVPLFIQIGEKIKVDTRTGEYVSRA